MTSEPSTIAKLHLWRLQFAERDGVEPEQMTPMTEIVAKLEAFGAKVERLIEAARDPLGPGNAAILELSDNAWTLEADDLGLVNLFSELWNVGVAIQEGRQAEAARRPRTVDADAAPESATRRSPV
jgi:hypothetical protein